MPLVKNWKWIGATVGVALVAVTLWWFRPFAHEPVYHGRTVTAWMDHMALFDQARDEDSDGPRPVTLPHSPDGL